MARPRGVGRQEFGSYVGIALSAPLVQTWLDPSTNYGLVLDHPLGGRTVFGSSDGPLASRPTLQVCYDPPSCTDGIQNQGETGLDCGGPCPTACCVPQTTCAVGECGLVADGCGGTIDCGACATCPCSGQAGWGLGPALACSVSADDVLGLVEYANGSWGAYLYGGAFSCYVQFPVGAASQHTVITAAEHAACKAEVDAEIVASGLSCDILIDE